MFVWSFVSLFEFYISVCGETIQIKRYSNINQSTSSTLGLTNQLAGEKQANGILEIEINQKKDIFIGILYHISDK